MALTRMVLEMGMGVDLHGGDATKAARRAVEDALRHASLSFVQPLTGGDPNQMYVRVIVGVPRHQGIRAHEVLRALPYGIKTLEVHPGGLEVPSPDGQDVTLIATAAVVVSLDLPAR